MSVDIQHPVVITKINNSRFLISSASSTPRSSEPSSFTATATTTPIESLSATARRLARKRSVQLYCGFAVPATPPAASTDGTTTTTPVSPTDIVKLGTVDLSTVIRSFGILPDAQSESKPHKPSPPSSTPSTPRAFKSFKLASPSSPSSPRFATVSKTVPTSAPLRFNVPVVPRPGPRLPLFHPYNRTPLPDISQQPTLIQAGPSPPPARRSSARARKPAAKAMALSLGLASDGSGLDGLDPALAPSGNQASNNTKDASDKSSHKARSNVKADRSAAASRDDGDASIGGDASKGTRRAPKRKAALAAEPIIDGIDDDSGAPLAKKSRRAQDTGAGTHAPSPLSNELARGPGSPPITENAPISGGNSKSQKRKSESPANAIPDEIAAALVASPPLPAPSKSKSKSASKSKSRAKSAKTQSPPEEQPTEKKSEEPTERQRSGSSSLTAPSRDEKVGILESAIVSQETKVEEQKPTNNEEDDSSDDEPPRTINIFQEPLELKPRPRPTYTSHLKRSSIGSIGEVERSTSRSRKSRKTSTSRGHSRKNSDGSNDADSTHGTPESPAKALGSSTPPDAMEVDLPNPIMPPIVDVPEPSPIPPMQA